MYRRKFLFAVLDLYKSIFNLIMWLQVILYALEPMMAWRVILCVYLIIGGSRIGRMVWVHRIIFLEERKGKGEGEGEGGERRMRRLLG